MFNAYHESPTPFEGDVILLKDDKPITVFSYDSWGRLYEIVDWENFAIASGLTAECLADCNISRFDNRYSLITLDA